MSKTLGISVMDGAFAWTDKFNPDKIICHEMVQACINDTIYGKVKHRMYPERGSKIWRGPQRRMKKMIKHLASEYDRMVIVGKSMGAVRQIQNYNWAVRKGYLDPTTTWLFFIDIQDKVSNSNNRYKDIRSYDDLPNRSPQNYFQTGNMGGYRIRHCPNQKIPGVDHFGITTHPKVIHELKQTLIYAAGL